MAGLVKMQQIFMKRKALSSGIKLTHYPLIIVLQLLTKVISPQNIWRFSH